MACLLGLGSDGRASVRLSFRFVVDSCFVMHN
jgi:hypothetical protein